ncbi:MAG: hypothetical protein V4757_04520 [Pseudomonadota bacterium]
MDFKHTHGLATGYTPPARQSPPGRSAFHRVEPVPLRAPLEQPRLDPHAPGPDLPPPLSSYTAALALPALPRLAASSEPLEPTHFPTRRPIVTQKERYEFLAKTYGDKVFTVQDALQKMRDANMLPATRGAGSNLMPAMTTSGMLTRVSPGRYRIAGDHPEPLPQPASIRPVASIDLTQAAPEEPPSAPLARARVKPKAAPVEDCFAMLAQAWPEASFTTAQGIGLLRAKNLVPTNHQGGTMLADLVGIGELVQPKRGIYQLASAAAKSAAQDGELPSPPQLPASVPQQDIPRGFAPPRKRKQPVVLPVAARPLPGMLGPGGPPVPRATGLAPPRLGQPGSAFAPPARTSREPPAT